MPPFERRSNGAIRSLHLAIHITTIRKNFMQPTIFRANTPCNLNLEEEQPQEKIQVLTQTRSSMTPPLGNCEQLTIFRTKLSTSSYNNSNLEERGAFTQETSVNINSKKKLVRALKTSLKYWHWHPRGGEMCSRRSRTADWNRHSGLPSRVLEQQQKFRLQQASDLLLVQSTRLEILVALADSKFFLQLNNYHELKLPMQPPNSPKQGRETWEIWDRLGDLPALYVSLVIEVHGDISQSVDGKILDQVYHFELKVYTVCLDFNPSTDSDYKIHAQNQDDVIHWSQPRCHLWQPQDSTHIVYCKWLPLYFPTTSSFSYLTHLKLEVKLNWMIFVLVVVLNLLMVGCVTLAGSLCLGICVRG